LQVDEHGVDPSLLDGSQQPGRVRPVIELPRRDGLGALDLQRWAFVGLVGKHDDSVELIVRSHVRDQVEAELVETVAAGREGGDHADSAGDFVLRHGCVVGAAVPIVTWLHRRMLRKTHGARAVRDRRRAS